MRQVSGILVLLLSALACAVGCRNPEKQSEENLLNPPKIDSKATGLDVFFITLPEQKAEQAFASVWREGDAQRIDPHTRQQQMANGLQVAVLGWRLPSEIQHLIEERSEPLHGIDTSDPDAPTFPQGNVMTPADLQKLNRVSIRRVFVQPNHRPEIVISREFESLPLLLVQDGEIVGGDYENAQGVLGVRASQAPGGLAHLEFDTELQHGAAEQRIQTGGVGYWQMMHSKQKVSMPSLGFTCDLSPGEFVAIGSLPGKPGSVGDRFFEDNSTGQPRRKLLLIRLAQTPGSELFGGLPGGSATPGN